MQKKKKTSANVSIENLKTLQSYAPVLTAIA